MRQLGADHADHERVDAHLRRPLHGHGGGQLREARLGRAVRGGTGRGPAAADTADHHDRTPAAAQSLVRGEGRGQRCDQVQLDDSGVPFGVGVREAPVRCAARVVDEDVEPGQRAEEGVDGGHVAQVEGDELDALQGLFGRPAGTGHDPGAGIGERPGDPGPHTPGAAGDDDGSVAGHVVGSVALPAVGPVADGVARRVIHRPSRSSAPAASFEASHLTNVWWKGS